MLRSSSRLSQWIFALASALYFGAAILRTILTYQNTAHFFSVLGRLAIFLILFVIVSFGNNRISRFFILYLVFQTGLVFSLLTTPGNSDYFGVLLNLVSLQVMRFLDPRISYAWIGFCLFGMIWIFNQTIDIYSTIALSLIYTAGSVFLSMYTRATLRAQSARQRNQSLADELQEANRQLKEYSRQLEQLAIARERNRLARELHDSVTQTVFSMTLVTQAAAMCLERDPAKVAGHLERLNQLSRSALAEMQLLVTQLDPKNETREKLADRLHRHLSSSRFPPGLAVSMDVEGDQALEAVEEQGLFGIAEEALNNIIKHSQAAQACVRLHLADPAWMEIEDRGRGFDLSQARGGSRVGLSSMRERAAEIGWHLHIESSPGAGTRIRVEKAPNKEGLA